MTKKLIKFTSGDKEMTYEEVLKQFEPMLNKFANYSINQIEYNKPEKEEMMQELRLRAWQAYCRYNGNYKFSTYLHYYLLNACSRVTTKLYAKKRTNINGSVSFQDTVGGSNESDDNYDEIIGEDDERISSLEFQSFYGLLLEILNDEEKLILHVLMDKKDFSVRDLADELGVTRQGAYKKVNKLKEKIGHMLITSGYVEN